jgi:putative CocE/NonD family hydrolase
MRPYRGFDLFRPLEEPYFSAWAAHGYAVLTLDIAGSGQSTGLLAGEYLTTEIDEAIAAIDWCAAQDWCDGHVGMSGMSWSAFTALRAHSEITASIIDAVLAGAAEFRAVGLIV